MAASSRVEAVLAAALFLGLGMGAPWAVAGPSDYVYPAVVEEGERELDFKAGSASVRGGGHEEQQSLGIGVGVNSRWFTEVYAKWHREPGDARSFDAIEWENRLQLTETGRHAVDAGLLVEVERPQDRSEGYEVRWGLLLQKDLSPAWRANLNLLLEHHLAADEGSKGEFGYQWQMMRRWRPQLEFGLQGFGSTTESSNRLGPVLAGSLRLNGRQKLKYNAGWLWGTTTWSSPQNFRMQVEYEF
ncbi:MAG: hypothetical protein RLZZ200_2751 [Pseudomonadota bacterium]|jgi:hypothetical protein